MQYPDYDPTIDSPPLGDDELAALDTLLQALPADAAMNIEALDGYLTALLVGPPPGPKRRSADWLPVVWGGDGADPAAPAAPFASEKQRKRVTVLVLRHLHALDRVLTHDVDAWEPIFSVADDGSREWVDAQDWSAGFLQAVALDPAGWEAVFDDPALAEALVPLALLGGDEAQLSAADAQRLADPAALDALSRTVVDAVLALLAAKPRLQA